MNPEVGILCVPRIYITLTLQSTPIDTIVLVEDILCVPGLYIILICSTPYAVKWASRNTMHMWGIHHIDSEYITHR